MDVHVGDNDFSKSADKKTGCTDASTVLLNGIAFIMEEQGDMESVPFESHLSRQPALMNLSNGFAKSKASP